MESIPQGTVTHFGGLEMDKQPKKSKIWVICFFHIIYLLLIAGCILYNYHSAELLLMVLGIVFYVLSLLSYIMPKFIHHVLYKLGEWILKKSDAVIVYENDAYKKYVRHRWLILFFSYFFISIDIVFSFLG